MLNKCEISIITPIYNSSGTLKQYLAAIFNSSYKNFEVIIVDDSSNNDPSEITKDYSITYRRLLKRSGSAFARNAGSEIAQGEILLFIDPDIIIYPDTLQKVKDVFLNHPEISALIGSYDDLPGAKNFTSQFKFLYHHYIHQREPEYVTSFWTGCGAIKKEIFMKLGKFDTNFFNRLNSVNDIELGYRISKGQYKIYNANHIQVKHLRKLSFFEWFKTDILDRALPWMKIILKKKDLTPKLNINWVEYISTILAGTAVLFLFLSLRNILFLKIASIFCASILFLNYGVIKFFIIKRGIFFATISIFYLYLFYLYCGISVLLAIILYFLETIGIPIKIW